MSVPRVLSATMDLTQTWIEVPVPGRPADLSTTLVSRVRGRDLRDALRAHQGRSQNRGDVASGRHFVKEEWLAPGEYRSPRKSVQTAWECVGGPRDSRHVTSSLPAKMPYSPPYRKPGRRHRSLALGQPSHTYVLPTESWCMLEYGGAIPQATNVTWVKHSGTCVSAKPHRCSDQPAVATSAGPRVLN